MRSNQNRLYMLCLTLIFANSIFAQYHFKSQILSEMSQAISLPSRIEGSEYGCVDAGTYRGQKIHCDLTKDKQIVHIGFNLFAQEMKVETNRIVCDFLERYLLQIKCIETTFLQEDRLRDDKFLIEQGSLSVVSKITPNTAFSLEMQDYKYYRATWFTETGKVLLKVAFPINYELLLGLPKVEIEKQFKQRVLASSHSSKKGLTPELEPYQDGIYRNCPISHYHIPSLNTAQYYKRVNESKYVPCFESTHKWYSAANLFQGLVNTQNEYQLYVEQNLYGFKKESFTIPLAKWLDYCAEQKLEIFFAVEEEREDGAKALLIAHSKELGFNHMLSLIIPDNFIQKHNSIIKATLNAYIPTQNVKELYQTYKSRSRKRI